MLRLYVGLLTGLIWVSAATAQETGPDPTRWLEYGQSYLKISVVQPGIYRISSPELQRAGAPTNHLNPATLRLFHRGTEQAIRVGGDSSTFARSGYVEFYGRGNDGAPDSLLYTPHRAQPHPYYSLFSDTTAYFLTWQLPDRYYPFTTGTRMAIRADTVAAGLPPEPLLWLTERRLFTDTYPAGVIYPLGAGYDDGAIRSDYDTGEGWSGPLLHPSDSFDQSFTLTNSATGTARNNAASPTVRLLVVGRSAGKHRVQIWAGQSATTLRLLDTLTVVNYETRTWAGSLAQSDASTSESLLIRVQPDGVESVISVSYLEVTYPRSVGWVNVPNKENVQYEIRLGSGNQPRRLLRLTDAPTGGRVFDLTDPDSVTELAGRWQNGTWHSVVSGDQPRSLWLANTLLSPVAMRLVRFRNVADAPPNFVIISYKTLRQPVGNVADPVRAYAAYRASTAGGGFDTLTVDIGDLFDQFSYGERHPLAIRRFMQALRKKPYAQPPFLLLIGQSRDPQGVRKRPDAPLLDLIPNVGWPGSDVGLVSGLAGEAPGIPALPVGRLNASRPQQVVDYLAKVMAHERTEIPALWRKNVLHLSGGQSLYERQTFRSFLDDLTESVTGAFAGARVTTLSKQTDEPVEVIPLASRVNAGVGLLTLFGHSGLDVTDLDIGFVTDETRNYHNEGRYPFLFVNGCAAGNFFFGRPTLGTNWVLAPDRGAIGFLAHAYNGFPTALKRFSDQFYAVLADSQFVSAPIGQIHRETIRRYLQTNHSIFDQTTAQQMVLQGDPAVRIFPHALPDFAFAATSTRIRDGQGNGPNAQADSLHVSAVLLNYGRTTGQSLMLQLRQFSSDGHPTGSWRTSRPAPGYADTLRWTVPRASINAVYWELTLDPDEQISESSETNNGLRIDASGAPTPPPTPADTTPPTLTVLFDGKTVQEDEPVAPQPVIDVLVQDDNRQLLRTDTTGILLFLQRPCPAEPCPYERVSLNTPSVNWQPAGPDTPFRLRYQPAQPWPNGRYGWLVTGRDLSANWAEPYQMHVTVVQQATLRDFRIFPNPFAQRVNLSLTVTGETPPPGLSICIRDLSGRIVCTLYSPPHIGRNAWTWDGTNEFGFPLPDGIYVYSLSGTDSFIPDAVRFTGRLILRR